MKPFRILAAVVCLFIVAAPLAAEPNANKGAAKERMAKFDTDGDGKLSPDERAAMKAELGERKAAGNGRAKLDGEGKAGRQQEILQEFDANGNGKLDPNEQAAARKAAAERRKQRKLKGHPEAAPDQAQPQNGIQPFDGQPLGGGAGPRGDGRAKLMERFDLNRDGRLSPQEEARAREVMQKQGGPGQFGGGAIPPNRGPGKPRGPFKQ